MRRFVRRLCNRPSRHFLALAFLCVVSVGFVAALISAWFAQVSQPVTCSLAFGELEQRNGYIEIQITEQHPVEPYFQGLLFLLSPDPAERNITSVSVMRSAEGGYAQSNHDIAMVWDEKWNALRPQRPEPFDVVARTGLHQYFPFDSATFEFDLVLRPVISFKVLRLVNRVPGFMVDCGGFKATGTPDGNVHVVFSLRRSPLIQPSAITFGVAAAVFLVLIIRFTDRRDLAVSVASYFLSLWSLRGIMAQEIHTFPTLFDCWLLTVSMAIVVMLCWRSWDILRAGFTERPDPRDREQSNNPAPPNGGDEAAHIDPSGPASPPRVSGER